MSKPTDTNKEDLKETLSPISYAVTQEKCDRTSILLENTTIFKIESKTGPPMSSPAFCAVYKIG
ncbi:hypothetical protein [Enterococcus mundtii]|uniref:hypothetical protein n=1 Tax=Enterococcus mundtii TaxID=53346 RepID=UPI0002F5D826